MKVKEREREEKKKPQLLPGLNIVCVLITELRLDLEQQARDIITPRVIFCLSEDKKEA